MDAAVRGTDATRRIRGTRESAPAFRASDRERETDTTRWNVDAALAIEVCADDCGEALFLVACVPKADETRQRTEDDELRTLGVESRRLQKVPETLNVKLRSGARFGVVSTSPRAETEESLD
jgi:phosphoglycolate phosphatase-like HAD superfamily hydrolase